MTEIPRKYYPTLREAEDHLITGGCLGISPAKARLLLNKAHESIYYDVNKGWYIIEHACNTPDVSIENLMRMDRMFGFTLGFVAGICVLLIVCLVLP